KKMHNNGRTYRMHACTLFALCIFSILATVLLLSSHVSMNKAEPAVIPRADTARANTGNDDSSSSSNSNNNNNDDDDDDVVSVSSAQESQLAAQDAAYASHQSLASAALGPADSAKVASEFARWTASQAAAAAASATPMMKPLQVVNDNAADAITCVSKSSDHGESFNTQDCTAAIQTACRKLSQSKTGAYFWDQWVWSSNGDCSMAYWLPESVRNTSGVPSQRQCADDVFGVMNTGCGSKNGGKSAASVNVAKLPDGKGSVGQLVDPGKVGYLMAASPWRCDYGCSD
ncbi:MAG: hypothetical protein Q9191_006797, partial [Dirinaria sp. TL-2023a]